MNLYSFTGNLGRDAEVKTLTNTTVCEFSVAVKSGYGDREKTNWVRCTMFGKRAEGQLPAYLLKGTQVAVSGELSLEEWEGQNGHGAAIAVNVSNIDLIGGRQDAQPAQQQGGYQQQAPQRPRQGGMQQGYQKAPPPVNGGYQQPQGAAIDFDQDVPF